MLYVTCRPLALSISTDQRELTHSNYLHAVPHQSHSVEEAVESIRSHLKLNSVPGDLTLFYSKDRPVDPEDGAATEATVLLTKGILLLGAWLIRSIEK